MSALLQLTDFGVALRREARAPREIVTGVTMSLAPGECCALLGESGAGKTTLLLALAGLLPGWERAVRPAARWVVQGRAVFCVDGHTQVLPIAAAALRGRGMAFLPQDPGSGLDPAQSALHAVREMLDASAQPQRAADLLARLGLDASTHRLRTHELSVGMAQRVQIAATLATQPRLLMLDEPTSALDRRSAAALATLLRELMADGLALLVATHDAAFARRLGGSVQFLRAGRVVEQAPPHEWFAGPRHSVARATQTALAQLQHVSVHFGARHALQDCNLTVAEGEIIAVLGPSGAGKTTLLSVLAGMVPPTTGSLRWRESEWETGAARNPISSAHGASAATEREHLRRVRRVFQDPLGSLNPRVPVLQTLLDARLSLCGGTRSAALDAAERMLELVGLPTIGLETLPGQLSAGQRQRLGLARALITEPDLLLADEPVAALDPLASAALFRLVAAERQRRGMAAVLVLHDPAPVAALADRYMVLDAGRCVDSGAAAQLAASAHPLTRALCALSEG